MKDNTLIAMILINMGIAAFAFLGFSYTKTENGIDLGFLQLKVDTTILVAQPRIVAGVCLVTGIALLLGTRLKKSLKSAEK
jgi:uncharacterized membrane protein YidH (DUF202 family)